MRLNLWLALAITLATTAAAFAADGPCTELTGLQVAAGFVTWMGVLQVFAIVIGVLSFGVLFWRSIARIMAVFAEIPVSFYETAIYGASVVLILAGDWVASQNQLWPVMTGSLLFAAALTFSGWMRKKDPSAEVFFGTLLVVWAVIAIYYHSSPVGFLAAGAFMGLLGFSAAVIPMGYAVGFKDEDSVGRATMAAFATTALAVAWRLSGKGAINPFLDGALWLGPFVFYLGLLILASRYYRNGTPYILRQVAPIVAGMAAIGIGNVFSIPQLSGIGGTFFVLYLVEKASDIPARSLTQYALVGLFTALAIGGGVYWAQNHMDVIQPYLLF